MQIGCVHPGTSLGMFLHRIGSLNTVPPRMFLMVPLGDSHIFFKLNSANRSISHAKCWCSDGTFDSGLIRCDGGAFDSHIVLEDGMGRVDGHLVVCLVPKQKLRLLGLNGEALQVPVGQPEVVVEALEFQVGENEGLLDFLPDDPGQEPVFTLELNANEPNEKKPLKPVKLLTSPSLCLRPQQLTGAPAQFRQCSGHYQETFTSGFAIEISPPLQLVERRASQPDFSLNSVEDGCFKRKRNVGRRFEAQLLQAPDEKELRKYPGAGRQLRSSVSATF
ncbi:hypothetical protein HUJ05_004259 [Dendroctonus ponderosae]|nr:hypothetical protein HUJ05_004259 [Dendroctonus ponderosae]